MPSSKSIPKSSRDYGDLGEEYAVELLESKGYKILEKNFKSKIGEIDIMALDGDTLVFVEVKTRWSKKYGRPEEAVTPKKINKIKKVGQLYALTHPNLTKKMRIDVVAIEVERERVRKAKIINV